ncbi:MAG: acyl-CoA dehydrogenase family protein, partial [Bacteroidetes bacterium]|nr:acyl-CoA dehydrogenase family protein [Bacteroidota bacterium]
MDFTTTENQQMIADMIKSFGAKHVTPNMMEWDEKQEFPRELFTKLGKLGLMGVLIPTELGGSNMGYMEYVTAISEISKIDGSLGLSVAAHNSLCAGHIMQAGNDEQKKKYLTRLSTGEIIGAFCLSEPEAGSDATSQRTTAVDKGDHYLLNGTKNWITNGNSASIYLEMAQTNAEK